MEKEKILYSDERAATYVTDIKGWIDKDRIFYGDGERAEHRARYSSCTHIICECGAEMRKGWTKCDRCREKARVERYEAMPQQEWDGETPLYCDATDEYFFDASDIEERLEEGVTLQLIICKPQHLSYIDADHWEDVLPEDHGYHDLPSPVQKALDTLNQAIRDAAPISWIPGKFATTYNADDKPVLAALEGGE